MRLSYIFMIVLLFSFFSVNVYAKTVEIKLDPILDYTFTKKYPLTFDNNNFRVSNTIIKPTIYVQGVEKNLSSIPFKLYLKDNKFSWEFGFNITQTLSINLIDFNISNMKKYDDISLSDGKIRLIFEDLKDKGDLLITDNRVILLNPTTLNFDPTIEMLPNSTNKAYTTGTTTHVCANNPANALTEFTDTQYSNVNASDNTRYSLSTASIKNQCKATDEKFTFNVSAEIPNGATVDWIRLCMEGYFITTNPDGSNLISFFNITSNSWVTDTIFFLTSETTQCHNFTSGFSSLYNSSMNFTFGIEWQNDCTVQPVSCPVYLGYMDFVNASMGYTEAGGDTTPPIVTIQSPVNNTVYPNNSIWFNVTLDEAGNACLVNISNINNTLTNSSGNWNKLNNTLPDGNYWTRFYCNDTAGNMNSSVYINFTIDTTPPIWSNNWTSTPATYSPTQSSIFNVTWTDNIAFNKSLIWFNTTVCTSNCSMTNYASNNWTYSVNLPAGSYGWKSYGNDTINNHNVTPQWNFSIGLNTSTSLSISPLTTVTYPTATQTGCQNVIGDSGATLTLYRNATQVYNSSYVIIGGHLGGTATSPTVINTNGLTWGNLTSWDLNNAWVNSLGWGNISNRNLNIIWIGSLGFGNLTSYNLNQVWSGSLGGGNITGLSNSSLSSTFGIQYSNITGGFPSACGAGNYVSAIGSSLTCSVPIGSGNTTNQIFSAVDNGTFHKFTQTITWGNLSSWDLNVNWVNKLNFGNLTGFDLNQVWVNKLGFGNLTNFDLNQNWQNTLGSGNMTVNQNLNMNNYNITNSNMVNLTNNVNTNYCMQVNSTGTLDIWKC